MVMCLTVATLGFAQTDDAWSMDYKRIEQSIRQPEFAEHTYLVTDNGVSARNDAAKNQKAINRLIERCSRLGGGRVVIPAGEWHTGAIRLQSGVNLVIAKGARVCFSTDTSLYPLVLTACEGLDMYNFPRQAYTVHIMPPIYPDPKKSVRENEREMLDRNQRLCNDKYREVYGKDPETSSGVWEPFAEEKQ